jgi:hypothetical protein
VSRLHNLLISLKNTITPLASLNIDQLLIALINIQYLVFPNKRISIIAYQEILAVYRPDPFMTRLDCYTG